MKNRIKELNSALRTVHKNFLEQERIQAEQFFNRKIAPFEFLLMLTQDKNFSWLRPFSALVADIDEFVDEAEIVGESDLLRIKKQIDSLLKDPDSSIINRYNYHLSHDANFIMDHLKLKQELQRI